MNTLPSTVYWSDAQLAARYGVTRECLWGWSRKGRFPKPIRLTPGCTRWREDQIAEWEAARAGEGYAASPKGAAVKTNARAS